MRKYLGTKITLFGSLVAPLFVIGPIIFGISIISVEISFATMLLCVGLLVCSILWIWYIKKNTIQFFSWGEFSKEGIYIRCGFRKKTLLRYADCSRIGIGYYVHGILNSEFGSKVFCIFFSKDIFEEQYQEKINLWQPSVSKIKIEFDKELYKYLLEVLPSKKALMLKEDYVKMIKVEKRFLK